MKSMMRGMAIVAALLLASVAGVAAQEPVVSCEGPEDILALVEEAFELYRVGHELVANDLASALDEVKYLQDLLATIPRMCLGEDAPLTFYVWEVERYDEWRLMVSAAAGFEVDESKLDVSIREGVRSTEYCLRTTIFAGDPPVELGCSLGDGIRKDDIELITATVGGLFDDKRHFRCPLAESDGEIDIYACTER
ncbi:MAG: hypothetical protein OXH77_12855 [Anaerolineaceae bacterium]|nr:hypothetical protein [Anaerolineaceae bacterium]